MKIKEKIIQKFYLSKLGGWYLEFISWYDDKFNKYEYSTTFETRQIIRHAQTLAYTRGIKNLRNKVNDLVNVKDKKEFDTKLKEIELITLATEEKESTRVQFLKQQNSGVKKTKDIENAIDRTRMIEKRIKHFKELQEFNQSRSLLKEIRKQRREGNEARAKVLEGQWKTRYGKK